MLRFYNIWCWHILQLLCCLIHLVSIATAICDAPVTTLKQPCSFQKSLASTDSIMSNTTSTPLPPIVTTPSSNRQSGNWPNSILNPQSRRHLSTTNPIFGSARSVPVPANPVTMSPSPPLRSPASGPSSDEYTPQRGRSESRSSSLPPNIHATTSSDGSPPADSHDRRSVKHLTCFWWKEKGSCKYSEEECLYAHSDTGKLLSTLLAL